MKKRLKLFYDLSPLLMFLFIFYINRILFDDLKKIIFISILIYFCCLCFLIFIKYEIYLMKKDIITKIKEKNNESIK